MPGPVRVDHVAAVPAAPGLAAVYQRGHGHRLPLAAHNLHGDTGKIFSTQKIFAYQSVGPSEGAVDKVRVVGDVVVGGEHAAINIPLSHNSPGH